jgi:hypothetical protein
MTKRKVKAAVELTPEELARYACNDCGANVVTAGEFYMLRNEIWEDQLGLGWSDNLCVGCLETRLGREISMADCCTFPNYPWMQPTSDRLRRRLFEKCKGKWVWRWVEQPKRCKPHALARGPA